MQLINVQKKKNWITDFARWRAPFDDPDAAELGSKQGASKVLSYLYSKQATPSSRMKRRLPLVFASARGCCVACCGLCALCVCVCVCVCVPCLLKMMGAV